MTRRAAETHTETTKWFDEKNAKRVARGAAPLPYPDGLTGEQMDEQEPAQQFDQPAPAEENLTNLITYLEEVELDDFGFVLFRTHYFDQQSWNTFEKVFYELLDEGIAAVPVDSGRKFLDDKAFMRIVSDDSLDGQSPEGISRAYRICLEEDDILDLPSPDNEDAWGDKIEPGLATSMCLMIDEECIRSVVNRTAGSTPFVKAVDGTFGVVETLGYEGVFKVAINSLFPVFYAALLVYDAIDVASKVSNDGIWRDIGSWHADIEGKRALKLSES